MLLNQGEDCFYCTINDRDRVDKNIGHLVQYSFLIYWPSNLLYSGGASSHIEGSVQYGGSLT